MLPPDLAARLDPAAWRMPSVVRLIGALGGLDDEELRATFNAGLGMTVAVAREAVDTALGALDAAGCPGRVVGVVAGVDGLEGVRYAEGPLG
jgi:phosphoribosylformylglycinamidine cyclo-ligase